MRRHATADQHQIRERSAHINADPAIRLIIIHGWRLALPKNFLDASTGVPKHSKQISIELITLVPGPDKIWTDPRITLGKWDKL